MARFSTKAADVLAASPSLAIRPGVLDEDCREDPADPQGGVSATAFWPTLDELLRLLFESGYGRVETLALLADNRHGPRVHLAASRP